jgi:hypothetical protein
MLLMHQGDAPALYAAEGWERLADDEQKAACAACKAIGETPGVTPGLQMRPPEPAR